MTPGSQLEFDFNPANAPDGLAAGRAQRRTAVAALAARLGLPLGRRVEVRLADGVILEGELRLQEEGRYPELVDTANVVLCVGAVSFRHSEIEACVCRD